MARFAGFAFLGAAALWSCDAPPSNPQVPLLECALLDVQGLWGGRNLWIREDGSAVLQVVTPPPPGKSGLWEKRYEFKVDRERWSCFETLVGLHDFLDLKIRERPGVPDEARPTIRVVPKSGPAVEVCKWANDKEPRFDPLYQFLLGICRSGETGKPAAEGAFDHAWRPPGFSSKP